jgi:hypothetical protein
LHGETVNKNFSNPEEPLLKKTVYSPEKVDGGDHKLITAKL